MRRGIFAAAAAVTVTLVPGAAFAQGAPGGAEFGQARQLAIQADLQLHFEGQSYSDNGGSGSDILIQPAADYFVIDRLSVGGAIVLDIASHSGDNGRGFTTTTFGFAPRVGYNIPILDNLSFWPDLFISFSASSTSNNGPSDDVFALGLFAPVLFHPVAHFFVGLGPNLSTELSHSHSDGGQSVNNYPKLTQYGIMSTIGGWFSL